MSGSEFGTLGAALYSLYSLYSLYRLMDKPASKQQTSMCKNSCRGARVSGSEFGTLGAAL